MPRTMTIDPDAAKLREVDRRYSPEPLNVGATVSRAVQTGSMVRESGEKKNQIKQAEYFQKVLDGGVESAVEYWNQMDEEERTRIPDPQLFGTNQKSLVSWWKMALAEGDYRKSLRATEQPYEEAAGTLYEERQISGEKLLEAKKPATPKEPKKYRYPFEKGEREEWELWKKEHGIRPPASGPEMSMWEKRRIAKGKIPFLEEDITDQQQYIENLKTADFNTTFSKKDMIGNQVEVVIIDEKDRRAKIKSAKDELDDLKKELRESRATAGVRLPKKPKKKEEPEDKGLADEIRANIKKALETQKRLQKLIDEKKAK